MPQDGIDFEDFAGQYDGDWMGLRPLIHVQRMQPAMMHPIKIKVTQELREKLQNAPKSEWHNILIAYIEAQNG